MFYLRFLPHCSQQPGKIERVEQVIPGSQATSIKKWENNDVFSLDVEGCTLSTWVKTFSSPGGCFPCKERTHTPASCLWPILRKEVNIAQTWGKEKGRNLALKNSQVLGWQSDFHQFFVPNTEFLQRTLNFEVISIYLNINLKYVLNKNNWFFSTSIDAQ